MPASFQNYTVARASSWLAGGAAAVVVLLCPLPAFATPAKAQQVAAQAKKAYDDGQYDRATELYLVAAREDDAAVSFVYAAARSAHMAGRLDQADELYRRALKTGKLPSEIAEKSAAYLDAIASKRAETLDAEADRMQQAGQYPAAADAWRAAAAAQPKRAVYLCRAGRAARLAGNVAQAQGDYQACRDKAAVDAPERADAERVLAEMAAAGRAQERGIAVNVPPGQDKTSAWMATAGAGVGLLAGATLLYLGATASAVANKMPVKTTDDVGKYNAAFDHAEGLWRGGAVVTGLGVVGAGVAAWLHVRGPKTVVALPTADGAMLAVRF